jgi:hypothetical protein
MKDKIRLPSHRDRGRVTCKPRRQIIEKVENMSNLDALIQDLVIANRILARERSSTPMGTSASVTLTIPTAF